MNQEIEIQECKPRVRQPECEKTGNKVEQNTVRQTSTVKYEKSTGAIHNWWPFNVMLVMFTFIWAGAWWLCSELRRYLPDVGHVYEDNVEKITCRQVNKTSQKIGGELKRRKVTRSQNNGNASSTGPSTKHRGVPAKKQKACYNVNRTWYKGGSQWDNDTGVEMHQPISSVM
jgi:hypothetical protein